MMIDIFKKKMGKSYDLTSLFINGHKEEYRRTLWLLKPTRLLDVQSNARLLSNDVPPEPVEGGSTAVAGAPRVFQRSFRFFPKH